MCSTQLVLSHYTYSHWVLSCAVVSWYSVIIHTLTECCCVLSSAGTQSLYILSLTAVVCCTQLVLSHYTYSQWVLSCAVLSWYSVVSAADFTGNVRPAGCWITDGWGGDNIEMLWRSTEHWWSRPVCFSTSSHWSLPLSDRPLGQEPTGFCQHLGNSPLHVTVTAVELGQM